MAFIKTSALWEACCCCRSRGPENIRSMHGGPSARHDLRAFAATLGGSRSPAILVLFADGLKIGLAVRIERILVARLPGSFEFGRGDVPVRPAFPADRTQVLAELF